MADQKIKSKKSFRVTWTVEIDAYDELDASQIALAIQRDADNQELTFDVIEMGKGNITHVNLNE